MKQQLKDHLYFFGHTNHPEIDHNTAFFEYAQQSEEDLAKFQAFKQRNAETLEDLDQISAKTGKLKANYYFNNESNQKIELFNQPPTCFTELTFAEP